MSSIYKRNGWWYYQAIINGRKVKKSLKTQDRSLAKQRQATIDFQKLNGRLGLSPSRVTISFCLDSFLENKKSTIKDSTYTRYCVMVVKLNSFFDGLVKNLTNSKISEYIAFRKENGISGKTIHEELAVLKSAIDLAWSNNIIQEIPIKKWPLVKKIPKKPDTLGYYSHNDISKLKDYFKDKPFECIFLFSLYTGCRLSEVVSASVEDIDLSSNVIRIHSIKTESNADNESRYVPLHSDIRPMLEKLVEERQRGLLFPKFSSMTNSQAAKYMKKACLKAGVAYKRFHGLRHTFATFLVEAGVDIKKVMAYGGWHELATVQRYVHYAEALKANLDTINF